jgi:hypothetical protein
MSNQNNNKEQEEQLARLVRRELALLRLDRWERALAALDEQPIDWKTYAPTVGAVTDTLTVTLEVKAADDDGTTGMIEGYLSTFGNEDLGRDIVERGAFTKSLALATFKATQHGTSALYPLLFQHDPKDPIGAIVAAKEDAHGLRIKTRLNTTIEHGRQALHGLANGYMAFSIGYKPTQYEYHGATRHLKEIDLKEGSAVTWPMNPAARALGNQRGQR